MVSFTVGFAVILTMALLSASEGTDTCGQKKIIAQEFISNGYKVLAGAWPWHGALFIRNQRSHEYACGVTILTEKFVITAAHCTLDPNEGQRLPSGRVFIKVGQNNLDATEKYAQQHNIERIIRHDGYDVRTFEDDIALMKLYTEITFNSAVQPICLWQGDSSLSKVVGKIGHIVGWGRNELFGLPKDLYEVTVPIISKQDCIDSDPAHYDKFYHGTKTFCAGYVNGTSAGQIDSGGGLFLRIGNHWLLRGIVSNGKLDPNTLAINSKSYVTFTDVSNYLPWIASFVQISNFRNGGLANLLDIADCGKDSYPLGTPEELKRSLNQYPWLAIIEFINLNTRALEDICHGVLIHPKFLLTAAHCVLRKRESFIRNVRLNDYRSDTTTDIFEVNGQTIRTTADRIAVKGISVHPRYNDPKFTNNIALVKLGAAATQNPICLPLSESTLPSNKSFHIIGWKKSSRAEKPLIRNVVSLAQFDGCRQKYAGTNIQLDTTGGQVCSTYNHDDDDSSCSHYMGSAPFQYVKNGPLKGRYFLAAISSFDHTNCRRDDFSDVFTNVAHYADWIREKVKANE
ncbi:polyserase-2-like [Uranotaenia lowii]|uniref:polyserase-2-like n=1 Tax=Uranotaenia lowii TaxID=190385 RepID=UPI0024789BB0|nr:polyserase-2-like [Uranotaenia lowii]